MLYGARQVLAGAVPYRDFWAIYGPAQYWTVAGLFKLLGTSILTERIWDSLVRAALAATTYALARRLGGRGAALAVWLLTLGWLWLVKFYGYPLLPAALFGLLAVARLLGRGAARAPRRTAFLAGMLAGVAALFRPDIGVYTLVAAAIWMATDAGAGRDEGVSPPARARVARLGYLAAGAAALGLPVLIYLVSVVPLADLSLQLVVYPATIYPGTRTLPFPSLVAPIAQVLRGAGPAGALDQVSRALALYSPWLILAVAGVRLWRDRGPARAGHLDVHLRRAAALLALVVLLYGVKSAGQAARAACRPCAAARLRPGRPPRLRREPRRTARRAGGGRRAARRALLGAGPRPARRPAGLHAGRESRAGARRSGRRHEGSGDSRPRGPVEVPPAAAHFRLDADQLAAVDFIRTHTAPGDLLFVGNGRHDLAFGSDVLFYFLADRTAATRHHEFNPGVTTSAAVQAEIIRALRAAEVPYVVRTDRFDRAREPNRSSVSSGVHDLDRFLQLDYVPVARVGRYEIARRRALAR